MNALMQFYGLITTLSYSKSSSPIFAQKKPKGKLRILIDLRRIIHLLRHDYDRNNHPIATLSDTAAHMAGKTFLGKIDASQAYHCLQMADRESTQLLAFNFASRTFAHKRLAQGLSRSVSAFSSFMRQYLDPIIKADRCAQYMDDIGVAGKTADEFIDNLEAVARSSSTIYPYLAT